jgi:hypothetical protein
MERHAARSREGSDRWSESGSPVDVALLVALIVLLTPGMTVPALAFPVPIPPDHVQTIAITSGDVAFAGPCHTTGFLGDTDCASDSDPSVADLFNGHAPTGRDVRASDQSAVVTSSAARFGNEPGVVGAPDGAVFARAGDFHDGAVGRVLLRYVVTDPTSTLGGLVIVRIAGAASAAVGGASRFKASIYQNPIFLVPPQITFDFTTVPADIQGISGGPCGGNLEEAGSLLCVTGEHFHVPNPFDPNQPTEFKRVTILGPGAFNQPPTVFNSFREGENAINEEFVVGVRAGTPFTVDLDASASGPAFAGLDPIVRADPRNPNLIVQRVEVPRTTGSLTSLLTDQDLSELALLGVDVEPLTTVFPFLVNPPPPSDRLAPTTVATPSPGPNPNGWNNADVAVALSAQDEPGGSGVKEVHFALTGAQGGGGIVGNAGTSVSIAAEGTTTLTYFAVDNAGNQEAPRTLTVKIDKTPPTVTFGAPSPTPNAAGWNNADVSVPFSASDSLSGVDTVSAASPLVLTTEGVAVRGAVTVSDRAGNSATVTSPAVKIDKTSPTVACSVSPNILWPPNHKLVDVTASVTVTDALSGPAGFVLISAANTEPTGSDAIQGFVVGTPAISGQLQAERLGSGSDLVYTLTYKGADKAGNSTTCNTTVTVPHDQGQ